MQSQSPCTGVYTHTHTHAQVTPGPMQKKTLAAAWYCCWPVPEASAHSAKDEEKDGGQAMMGPWVEGEEQVGKVANHVGTA